ncbi:2-oxoglutarate dehydrogenase complex dihydrolipoyllysine-residue succinyltransferase [Chelativorans sp. SCAU2101]|uniref:Dihydrolipoyllysine-residue succinyltransferase component of 2-oxoglutarate dehydrogenase complex n=1 Tax=Chelativorans petroleitrophicus TaxID=2975484 RepID=A0A9X3AYZ1_9HYPH|nr:2-oxoglutarate dehydrogenase complex dihydrolipoyllysine-residue succinyltransferase [Chelativorans petroleitrophicus]MCT8988939.1 2-oxoglutarate dehydrogenase complex dihydrolipoyllysine-residue succinyltransferase [Chelativorans petroleitrophicus]
MATEIRVPTLGESVTEATIGRWFKAVGDQIAADEPIVELETDKVTVEVPAPAAGTLSEITVKEGETVEVGALLGTIGEGGAAREKAGSTAGKSAEGKADMTSSKVDETRAAGNGRLVEVTVPSAGESVTEAQIGEIYKKAGDTVKADEPILELETDKAAQEIPSPVSGVIRELLVKSGEEVKIGALLARIEEGADAGKPDAAAQAAGPASASTVREAERKTAEIGGEPQIEERRPPAPSAAKLMKEQDLKPSEVAGTGKDGQVLKGDVLAAIEGRGRAAPSEPAEAPKVSRAPSPAEDEAREERVKMTRLRQTIARRLKDAQNTAAMLTTFNEVDMTAVMDLRKKYKDLFEKKHGVKLGFMGFFTKAVCHALKEIPAVNAEIDGTDIIYKNYCHIGVAVGTDRGLVVPVVRDADRMTIAEIEKEIGRLGAAAREGKLSMADMQGGTFTISNGGVYGSLMSTPILNAPQSGILGMHKIQERPMVVGGQIVIRPMMYLALSYDHRIVDGKEAVTFLVRVKEVLEDPERLVLDL